MMYEAWRITFQCSEQAARTAYRAAQQHAARVEQLEGELQQLRTAVREARNHIGDNSTGPAGLAAVVVLEHALAGRSE